MKINIEIKKVINEDEYLSISFDDILFLMQLMSKACGYNISEWSTHSISDLYQKLKQVSKKGDKDIPKLIFKLK